ncbi:MAG: hypothetical protein L0Y56_02330 [Nitrospira sp.]|nr:hypothetical protein [Nitrospira sp.]
MKKTSLIALLVLILLPIGVQAHEISGDQGLPLFNPEEGELQDVSGFVQDLATVYSHELVKGADSVRLTFQTRLSDDLHPGSDPYVMEGQQALAREVAQKAFRSVLRHTVEQVDMLQTLKSYGERMTFTQVRVTSNDIQMSGPSLNDSPNGSDADRLSQNPVLSVRSGMSLTDGIHLAPTIQAHLGELNSKVIYDPLAGGDWRFSLGRSITSRSSVEMVYLLKSYDDQNLLATFRFGF